MSILSIDQNVLSAVNSFFVGKSPVIDLVMRFLAVYLIYSLPIILLLMWFLITDEKKRIALVMSMVSLIIAVFGLNKIISHFWFRPRPDISIIGLKEVFFHRPDFSFPSDHASALFAIVFTLYFFGYKKAGNWFLFYALVITFFRVVIAVHYPLDILGGAVVALAAAGLVSLIRVPLEAYLYKPITTLLKKVHLA